MSKEITFDEIVAQIRTIIPRSEILLEEVPAPSKLAPHAFALTADVLDDAATARFVLLHDPAGQEGWLGKFRCVTFVRAAVDEEMATDPMVSNIGWTWLIEALAKYDCAYIEPSGTVTRVSSTSFGSLDEREDDSELEVRASWTPADGNNIPNHIRAWLDLLAHTAGLEPVAEGIAHLPRSTSSAK